VKHRPHALGATAEMKKTEAEKDEDGDAERETEQANVRLQGI